MAQLEPRMIQIKISIGSAKLEKLIELMPDYERDGQNTTPIYWAIQKVIDSAIAASNPQTQQQISNRAYLRDIGRK
jgi:hypothetical protein